MRRLRNESAGRLSKYSVVPAYQLRSASRSWSASTSSTGSPARSRRVRSSIHVIASAIASGSVPLAWSSRSIRSRSCASGVTPGPETETTKSTSPSVAASSATQPPWLNPSKPDRSAAARGMGAQNGERGERLAGAVLERLLQPVARASRRTQACRGRVPPRRNLQNAPATRPSRRRRRHRIRRRGRSRGGGRVRPGPT